jgi:hypothetical protein
MIVATAMATSSPPPNAASASARRSTNIRKKGRGTQGVIAIQTSDRNGALVGAVQLTDKHDEMLISNQGTPGAHPRSRDRQVGRNTQGVTLIRLPEDETLVGLERLDAQGLRNRLADGIGILSGDAEQVSVNINGKAAAQRLRDVAGLSGRQGHFVALRHHHGSAITLEANRF